MFVPRPSRPDFRLDSSLSLVLLRPESPAAERWLNGHFSSSEDGRWFDGALVLEPGSVTPILDKVRADGLEVAR